MDSPPVATTTERDRRTPLDVCTQNPSASRLTLSTAVRNSVRTPASRHSASSIATTLCAEPSQNSWPSVLWWYGMRCLSTSVTKSRGV